MVLLQTANLKISLTNVYYLLIISRKFDHIKQCPLYKNIESWYNQEVLFPTFLSEPIFNSFDFCIPGCQSSTKWTWTRLEWLTRTWRRWKRDWPPSKPSWRRTSPNSTTSTTSIADSRAKDVWTRPTVWSWSSSASTETGTSCPTRSRRCSSGRSTVDTSSRPSSLIGTKKWSGWGQSMLD